MSDATERCPPYENLVVRSREIALLGTANSLLHWDQQTYMPPAAGEYRASQTAQLSGLQHRLFTAAEVGEWIAACEAGGFGSDSLEGANIREWRRAYDRATKLPQDLVEEFARETSIAHEVWIEARKQSDFKRFQPHLEKIVALNIRMADLYGYEGERYDALLEGYETGASTGEIRGLFERLAPQISAIVRRGEAASAARAGALPPGPYPVAAQQEFNRSVAEAMGFNFEEGRIDTTTHPFCTEIGPRDVRLTTRYDENDFTSSLYSIMHEAGHGLYEQGTPDAHFGTPAGSAISLGIHESQSRLWENHVGRSQGFWNFWHAEAVRHFPQLAAITPDDIVRHVNRVARTFIRVEADEVTYDLHVILRFRIETLLISGEIKAADTPACWNDLFREIFGLDVPDDARGCLQDVHWSGGSFGYFPTYTLGSLNASQLFESARRAIPSLDASLAAGDYAPLLGWLRKNIHRHGSRYLPQDLIQRATGSPTQTAPHLAHLGQIVSAATPR